MSEMNAVRKSQGFAVAANAAVARMTDGKKHLFNAFFGLGLLAMVDLQGVSARLSNAIGQTAEQSSAAALVAPVEMAMRPLATVLGFKAPTHTFDK